MEKPIIYEWADKTDGKIQPNELKIIPYKTKVNYIYTYHCIFKSM